MAISSTLTTPWHPSKSKIICESCQSSLGPLLLSTSVDFTVSIAKCCRLDSPPPPSLPTFSLDVRGMPGVWKSENSLGCLSFPYPLFEKGPLVHQCRHQAGWCAYMDSPISISYLAPEHQNDRGCYCVIVSSFM